MRDDEKLPLTEHLEELRTRLIRCVIAIAVGTGVSYAFKEKIFEILSHPLIQAMHEGDKLIFTGITEAFFTYIKVSLLSGILMAIPVLLYEFWMFTAPGLYQHEKKVILPVVIISTFFLLVERYLRTLLYSLTGLNSSYNLLLKTFRPCRP